MNLVLLDQKTLGDDLDLSALSSLGNVTSYPTTNKEETLARIAEAEVIITNKVVINKAMMEQTPTLKLICIAATGMNNVDLEAAKALGIEVKNVTGYSTSTVVQHTFAMMFYLLERLPYYNQRVQDKIWSQEDIFTDISQPFAELSGKNWGIIGLGTIGKEVAKIAETFGCKISYHSTSGQNLINDYHHDTLEELLSSSDIVSIHAPLNDNTYNLINASNLHYLKENAILLNLGRGGIIDENDLAQELNKRTIYAGLDVTETEPINENNPLLSIKDKTQLIITPHLAWASIESRERLLAGILENIKAFLEKE
ncbi:MAG TPA: D-2-hydroxyacid dehydrogenase [Campylobacterales bacterium]|nr:D-2-hydroxyacid dehydrogenase [Campylobacterales bacterium]HHS93023.1 D-2-hydroxyacid dehydrogenase [Campylobacterales bacterium]